jgi:prepilin-type N-terminal cleavage/methylation domain-containing protein
MQRHGDSGFTIVELMIVVAIVLTLTLVAGGAYRKYVSSVRRAEVYSMFAEIRAKEEAYRAETATYLSSGAGEADLWPVLLAAGEPKAKSWLPVPAGSNWLAIGIVPPKSMLFCGYTIIAGPANAAPAGAYGAAAFGNAAPTTAWWYAMAVCDNDGKGAPNGTWVAASDRDTVYEENPQN